MIKTLNKKCKTFIFLKKIFKMGPVLCEKIPVILWSKPFVKWMSELGVIGEK